MNDFDDACFSESTDVIETIDDQYKEQSRTFCRSQEPRRTIQVYHQNLTIHQAPSESIRVQSICEYYFTFSGNRNEVSDALERRR